ncbi:MAG: diaminopimelate epimerase [Bacillota bacterium]|nr:diaminopimelate epimerase [Bacillota bacterium]
MQVTKMHGLGNDFVVVDGVNNQLPEKLNEFAQAVCDRHFGIGANGLLVVLPSEFNDIRMRIFNDDGSEAQMCGNGMRCFAAYVYDHDIVKKKEMRVETAAGTIKPVLIFNGYKLEKVRVDMGIPRTKSWEIPIETHKDEMIGEPMNMEGYDFEMSCISMGNPHAVTFWKNLDRAPVRTLGPLLENHPVFPNRANIEFVEIVSPTEIRMRVFERGCGETLACGTGASAAVVAAVLNGYTDKKVLVHLLGGDLECEWLENGHLLMTGPATYVACGEFYYNK